MFWGMLQADDAGIVTRSPKGLEMMTVIVIACAAFGLTVSKAKTEIMCLQTKGTCSSPLLQPVRCTNGRVCVLGRGYQRRLGSQKCQR